MKRLFVILLSCLMLFSSTFMFGFSVPKQNFAKKSDTNSNVLRICNCEDYIDESLLDEFEELTGIEVIYSTYGTNENLYNELVINPNSYDLVVPSEYMIQKLAVEGRINKLDLNRVPNYRDNVSPYIKEKLNSIEFTIEDGEHKGESAYLSEFMVGYMWGTMGWVYNTDFVDESDVSSWGNVFLNSSLDKKSTIKDSVRDSYLIGLAMTYKEELENATTNEEITEILNRTGREDIKKVGETLTAIKDKLYGFEVDSGKNDIILGNINAYVAWSGDAAYAIDVAAGEVEDEDGTILEGNSIRSLSYYVPDEGSNIWFDGFVMPSGSNNYELVYKFLNFISSPESVYRNMDYTGYTGMLGGEFIYENIVVDWFDESEDLGDDEGIEVDLSYFFGNDREYVIKVSEENYGRLIAQYPTEQIVERCAVMSYFDANTLLDVNEMWQMVKGETFPTWIIITCFAVIILLAVVIVLYRNKDKIKWLKLPERKKSYAERKSLKIIKIIEIK